MAAFAQDLERYLRGDPVLARPDSAWYRLRKFASRNRRCCAPLASRSSPPPRSALATSSTCRENTANRLRARSSCLRMPSRSGRFPARRPRAMSTAYREYLQARSLMLRPTEENLHEILRLAESATTRDPQFAHAFSLLGGVNVLFLDIGYTRPNALDLGEAAALRARALNPAIPARMQRSAASLRTAANGCSRGRVQTRVRTRRSNRDVCARVTRKRCCFGGTSR